MHDLRHTAAYRMARDPDMPLTDVQWILGHAHLTTTQIYISPLPEDVIASVLAHHQRRAAPNPHRRRRLTGRSRWTCCSGRNGNDDRRSQADTGPGPTRPGDAGRRPTTRCWSGSRPPGADGWPATRLAGPELWPRLLAEPFVSGRPAAEENRRRGLRFVLRWLEGQPGDTWQQRWLASGAGVDGRVDWRIFPIRWARQADVPVCGFDERVISTGLLSLVCADVIRPSLDWLLTTATPKRLAAEMARPGTQMGSGR